MANNQYVNKVVKNNTTLIDLTNDTATAADVLPGKTLHLASGATATGTGDNFVITENTVFNIEGVTFNIVLKDS